MRGRTNVVGGTDGELILGAEIQNFTVAQGNNIVAGNFVQYEIEESNTRYDGSYGYGRYFYISNAEYNFVLPCGNSRYIFQYVNSNNTNIWFIVLVDVSEKFNVLSTISVENYSPHFCLLNDGKMALSHMDSDNTFTIEIYDIQQYFDLISTYHLTDESIGSAGSVGIGQIEDGKIIVMKGWAIYACNYSNGNIMSHTALEIAESEKPSGNYAQNAYFDWVPYPIGGNKFLCFAAFGGSMERYSIIFEVEAENLTVVDNNSSLFPKASYIGKNVWGLGFFDGKMLYTKSGRTSGQTLGTDVSNYWNAYIMYVKNNKIMQSSEIDIYQLVSDAFQDLAIYNSYPVDTNSSGTIQFVKNDVIYAAVMPYRYTGSGGYYTNMNPYCRTAIIRIEYNSQTGGFTNSNVITFESDVILGEGNTRRFGFGKFFENENGNAYYLYETYSSGTGKTGRWLMSLNYKNGVLSMGGATKLVENYNGKSAIGVAKDSGKSGDIIEVYVPAPV